MPVILLYVSIGSSAVPFPTKDPMACAQKQRPDVND